MENSDFPLIKWEQASLLITLDNFFGGHVTLGLYVMNSWWLLIVGSH
jgi:hypothetical protein